MYTIRPFSAGVCGFDGPHPEIVIASVIAPSATTRAKFFERQVFFDRKVAGRPEVFCTG
jgi:hypothetical protein